MRARRPTPRRRTAPRWTPEEWNLWTRLLIERQAGLCWGCMQPLLEPIERHHRIRRRDGGDRASNVVVLHRACHAWVTEHPEEARARGFILYSTADPELEPILAGRLGWILLDDYGQERPDVPPSTTER